MQRIVHTNHGEPAEVLTLEAFSNAPSLVSGAALVRVSAAPVHPGDLLGVSASPAFGAAPFIPRGGRVPGVEGVGVVEALAADIDPSHRIQVGTRVAFFPVNGAWSSRIAAPVQSLIPVPDKVSDEVAAQMLVNTDVAKALELARNFPSLFPVAERYQASDYLGALEHTYRRGRTGMVLLAF